MSEWISIFHNAHYNHVMVKSILVFIVLLLIYLYCNIGNVSHIGLIVICLTVSDRIWILVHSKTVSFKKEFTSGSFSFFLFFVVKCIIFCSLKSWAFFCGLLTLRIAHFDSLTSDKRTSLRSSWTSCWHLWERICFWHFPNFLIIVRMSISPWEIDKT